MSFFSFKMVRKRRRDECTGNSVQCGNAPKVNNGDICVLIVRLLRDKSVFTRSVGPSVHRHTAREERRSGARWIWRGRWEEERRRRAAQRRQPEAGGGGVNFRAEGDSSGHRGSPLQHYHIHTKSTTARCPLSNSTRMTPNIRHETP